MKDGRISVLQAKEAAKHRNTGHRISYSLFDYGGMSNRGCSGAMGGLFNGYSYTTKCPKSQRLTICNYCNISISLSNDRALRQDIFQVAHSPHKILLFKYLSSYLVTLFPEFKLPVSC